jgi:polyisoprenoid-binding protein YceI
MTLARVPVSVGAAIVLTLVTSVATPVRAETETDTLDHRASAVDFTIYASKIFKFKCEGLFKEFTGQLSFDPANPLGTQVDLTVYTSSIDIHNDEHNQLLRSDGFFDVERFPTMHFASSSTDVMPDGTFSMTGDLTIHGITQRLTIPAKLKLAPEAGGPAIASFESTFEIDRTEFGLTGIAKTHGINVTISKTVQIHLAMATPQKRSGD